MAHFSSYNTANPQSGDMPLIANAGITPLVIEGGVASILAGTVASDQPGVLTIHQGFNKTHFDGASTIVNIVTSADGPPVQRAIDEHGQVDALIDGTSTVINVVAGVGQSFNIDLIAPVAQISYTNGSTAQKYLRLFVRAFRQRV